VVLSDAYLRAEYTQPEWATAFAEDPRGEHRKLVPLRVSPCTPEGLLKPIIYADLVGLSAGAAREAVLNAVSDQARTKPATAPTFPGFGVAERKTPARANRGPAAPHSVPSYPGQKPAGGSALSLWQEKLAFLQEHEAIASDASQKFTLGKQIEEARRKIEQLGG